MNAARKRTFITEIQKKTLESLFETGMKSRGRKCGALHEEAVKKTGLPLNVVKDWVGNHSRGNRKYFPTKRPCYSKGVSAYNLFVHEKKDEMQSMAEWSKKWQDLDIQEKNSYKERAKSLLVLPDNKRSKKVLLQNIYRNIEEISKFGVTMSALGVDKEGNQIFLGCGTSQEFFESRPKIHQDLLLFCSQDNYTNANEQEEISVMRKRASSHLNDLYSTAIKKTRPFPYKAVKDGKIQIEGLPAEIIPVQSPSCYGREKLMAILNCQNIEVNNCDVTAQENNEEPINSKDSAENQSLMEMEKNAAGDSSSLVETPPKKKKRNNEKNSEEPINNKDSAEEQNLIVMEINAAKDSSAMVEAPPKKKKRNNKKSWALNRTFTVEALLEDKRISGVRHYLVKWKGYDNSQNTWEPEKNVSPFLIADYFKKKLCT